MAFSMRRGLGHNLWFHRGMFGGNIEVTFFMTEWGLAVIFLYDRNLVEVRIDRWGMY